MSVPRTWRNRVAIVWGNGGHRVFHTLRFPRCGDDPGSGNAYAGGFFLRKPGGASRSGSRSASGRRSSGSDRPPLSAALALPGDDEQVLVAVLGRAVRLAAVRPGREREEVAVERRRARIAGA